MGRESTPRFRVSPKGFAMRRIWYPLWYRYSPAAPCTRIFNAGDTPTTSSSSPIIITAAPAVSRCRYDPGTGGPSQGALLKTARAAPKETAKARWTATPPRRGTGIRCVLRRPSGRSTHPRARARSRISGVRTRDEKKAA